VARRRRSSSSSSVVASRRALRAVVVGRSVVEVVERRAVVERVEPSRPVAVEARSDLVARRQSGKPTGRRFPVVEGAGGVVVCL